MSRYNQLITNISQITNENLTINTDDVITIDTLNNRIGIKTRNPSRELDVSGMINCNNIKILNTGDISLLNIQKIISIDTSYQYNIDVSNIKSNNIDVSFINLNQRLDVSTINCNTIDVSIINLNQHLDASRIDVSSINIKNVASIDCSLIFTTNKGISCENILVNNIYCSDNSLNIIGNVLISGDLSVNGTVFGKNTNGTTFGFLSDDRLKHNEKKIVNGLEIIRKLNPQKYQKTKNFKQPDFSGIVNEPYIIETGLIAQDVYKINDISYTVTLGNETKPYYLNYNDLFVYTIAGLKELDSFVQKIPEYTSIKNLANIENLLNNQNNIIQKLNAKISLLENKIYLLERNK